MKVAANGSGAPAPVSSAASAQQEPVRLHECPWGDSITGTKAQIQALGIGQGLAFPGEPGAPKRSVRTTDPRGFNTRIDRDGARFCAYITFPGRDLPQDRQPTRYAAGVTKVEELWYDEYAGTREALIAADLAKDGEFPGDPGMPVAATSFAANGERNQRGQKSFRTIRKVSAKTFRVSVRLPEDEGERRLKAHHKKRQEYEQRMASMPRPPRLPGLDCVEMIHCPVPRQTETKEDRELRDAEVSLARMPDSAEEFRCNLISEIRSDVNVSIEFASKPSDYHGYMIDAEPILMAFDAIAEAILQAAVTFDPERHERIAQGFRAIIAKHDGAFQRDLAQLVTPKPGLIALIDGEA